MAGHLTNLSTAPANEDETGHTVPMFPAESDPSERQGFVRVINHSTEAGEVTIDAWDDANRDYPTSTLSLDAEQTKHFNSGDLESGNDNKGLSGGTGAGDGDWRLALGSDLDIEALAYVRTEDGFLTAMHDTVPREGDRHRVPTFNPASNTSQASRLGLINRGDSTAEATISGIDDRGDQSTGTVSVSIPSGAARTLTAQELEEGAADIEGTLGDGAGKWQLVLESAQPLTVMSLLSSPTEHLTNLSTAPALAFAPAAGAMFADRVVGNRLVRLDSARATDFLADGGIEEGSLAGTYSYSRTGPNAATIELDFGNDATAADNCTLETTFASRTAGNLTYACDDGASGTSNWWLADPP